MMTASAVTARAPGKLVLAGEYAVLEGGPAWVTAVDRYVTVRAEAGEPGLTVLAPEPQAIPLDWNDGAWQAAPAWRLAAAAVTESFGRALPRLTIDSQDFFVAAPGGRVKAGFGSSAAVVAALLAAGRYAGAAPDALFAAARAVHHRAQGGLGSGVDIAASVYGGTFTYRIDGDRVRMRPLNVAAAVGVTAVWMGTSASTPDLLRKVLDFKLEQRAEYDQLMAGLRLTAGDVLYRAERNDVLALFDALSEYGRRMGQLGRAAGVPIVTEAMEELDSRLAGDAAVKPSGAGGGDVLLAFHRPEKAFDVARKVRAAGFDTLPLTFGAAGAAAGRGSRVAGHDA